MGLFSKRSNPPKRQNLQESIDILVNVMLASVEFGELPSPQNPEDYRRVNQIISTAKTDINHLINVLWPEARHHLEIYRSAFDTVHQLIENQRMWFSTIQKPDFDIYSSNDQQQYRIFQKSNRAYALRSDKLIRDSLPELIRLLGKNTAEMEALIEAMAEEKRQPPRRGGHPERLSK